MEKLKKIFFGNQEVTNPGAIDIYRIIFNLGLFVFVVNSYDQKNLLLYAMSRTDNYIFFFMFASWTFISFSSIFTVLPRFFNLINYINVIYFFNVYHGAFNVECKFIILGSFFNLFLQFSKKKILDSIDYNLILLVLLVLTGYLLYGGGITKLLDPYWSVGSGLYFVMALPWIKYPFLDFLLLSPLLLKILNYFVLFVEFFAFPFSLFARTRAIGILLLWCFSLFLFSLLQIFTIGFTALAFAVLFLAIFPIRIPILQHRISGLSLNLTTFFPSQRALLFSILSFEFISERFRKYIVIGIFAFFCSLIIRNTECAFGLNSLGRNWEIFDKANRNTFCFYYDDLFTAMHFVNIEEYRVKLKMKDGSMIEPVKVFDEDKTGGWYSGYIFNSRCLQAEMYGMNEKLLVTTAKGSKMLPWQAYRLFSFIETKVKSKDDIVSYHISTTKLLLPKAFDPNGSAYVASAPWKEVLVYYPENKEMFLPTIDTTILIKD